MQENQFDINGIVKLKSLEKQIAELKKQRDAVKKELLSSMSGEELKAYINADNITVERGFGYEIYYSDGRFFVDLHNPITHSYETLKVARDVAYYAGKRETKG